MGLTKVQRYEPHNKSRVDRIFHALAVYIIPACIVLASVFATLYLDEVYPDMSGDPVSLQVLPTAPNTALDPATVYETMREQLISLSESSGKQAWLLAKIPSQQVFTDYLLEIPSRDVSSILCWDAESMTILATATRTATVSEARMNKLGFTAAVGHLTQPRDILCYASFTESARVSARLWPLSDFQWAASRFDHGMGMLEGGLLTPAILIFLIALVTRESSYALLAIWLVANLRLGAYAIGWDSHWLGYILPPEAMPLIRQITAAVYYLMTVALLIRLLRANDYTGWPGVLKITTFSALALPVAAVLLPSQWFWPLVSLLAFLGLTAAVFLLWQLRARTSLAVRFWQTASLVLAFGILTALAPLVAFSDISALDSIHTTVVLLISSAAMVLAVAERLRNMQAEQRRLRTEQVTSYAITPIGMFTLDAQRRFIRMNPVLERMLGFSISERPDAVWTDFFPELDWEELMAKTRANTDVEITANGAGRSGKTRHFAIRAVAMDKTIEGSLQDISAHAAMIEQMRLLAGKDPVTEGLNQKSIEEAVARAIAALNSHGAASLAHLNLHHFKGINNLFGYTTGDALLIQTRQMISRTLKTPHMLGRIGGDEFAILFPGKTAAEVTPVVQNLADRLNNHLFTVGSHTMNIKVAIGLIDLDAQLGNAEQALFAAGRACRDARTDERQIVVYERNSAELREHREILRLFDQLEDGRTPDGFRLELQPILMLETTRHWGFEVLLRARDSHGNPLAPGRVIAAAEDIGAISTIDKWVLESILSWLDQHQSQLTPVQFVNVNISGLSLNSEPFTEHMFRLLDRYAHLVHRLVIELTEGVALESVGRTQEIITRLHGMKVRIALDDFGAGYTSFSYLRSLNADLIKIDGTLIKHMLRNSDNTAIVQTIVKMARHLNMKCIAEWVEDLDTMRALHAMGVDCVQGFAISASLPQEAVLGVNTAEDFIADAERRAAVRQLLTGRS